MKDPVRFQIAVGRIERAIERDHRAVGLLCSRCERPIVAGEEVVYLTACRDYTLANPWSHPLCLVAPLELNRLISDVEKGRR